jgi:hypothetical protein
VSFWDRFESKREGVNDTIEFVIRVAIVTLSAVVLVVVAALVVGLFVPNSVVDSAAILNMVDPAFQTIIGAFVGLLGGLSLNANARDKETPVEPEPEPEAEPEVEPEAPKTYNDPNGTVFVDTPDDDDDDMEPWEKYRNDLRYDANNDGVVDENDFPDWRNPNQ